MKKEENPKSISKSPRLDAGKHLNKRTKEN